MPSWPGGACPACGSYMPPRQIHCRECLALLDPELESDPKHSQWYRTYRRSTRAAAPDFVPLQEVASAAVLLTRGYYFPCPNCERELKVRSDHVGRPIACKACRHRFDFRPGDDQIQMTGLFGDCPHCSARVRVAAREIGKQLKCRACDGQIDVPSDLHVES